MSPRYTNLILNPGGEDGPLGMPANVWQPDVGNTLNVVSDFKRSGSYALQIDNGITPANSKNFQDIVVTPGKTYLLSGWIRTVGLPNTAGAGAVISVAPLVGITGFTILSKKGTSFGTGVPDVGLPASGYPDQLGFTYVECVFIPTGPMVLSSIRLELQLGYGSAIVGTAWFDDLRLAEEGAMLAALESPNSEMVHLLELHFSTGVVFFTTASVPISWNSQLWEAIGGAMTMGGIEESNDAAGQGVDVQLAGVDQTVIALLLSAGYRGRDVVIYRAALDRTTGLVLADPLLLFQGFQLSSYTIEETRDSTGGTVTISTRLMSQFGVDKRNGIQTSLASHRKYFPADTFFQNLPAFVGQQLLWGTK